MDYLLQKERKIDPDAGNRIRVIDWNSGDHTIPGIETLKISLGCGKEQSSRCRAREVKVKSAFTLVHNEIGSFLSPMFLVPKVDGPVIITSVHCSPLFQEYE